MLRGRALVVTLVVVSALAASTLPAAAPASAAERRFVSKRYGYALTLPAGWRGIAATTSFPGGDIDHTASYADTLVPPDEREVFALGGRTTSTLSAYARAHAAWLVANRPCRRLGAARPATLAGAPALLTEFTCDGGVFGRTFVAKWTTVRRGAGLIFTQMSPEGRRAADRGVLARLLRGLAWKT